MKRQIKQTYTTNNITKPKQKQRKQKILQKPNKTARTKQERAKQTTQNNDNI